MNNSPTENHALASAEKWHRYLANLQAFSAEPVALETQGTLVRVAGLVLEAAGIRAPVGSVCQIYMDERRRDAQPVLAAKYEARAVELGFTPPRDLDHFRK